MSVRMRNEMHIRLLQEEELGGEPAINVPLLTHSGTGGRVRSTESISLQKDHTGQKLGTGHSVNKNLTLHQSLIVHSISYHRSEID